MSDTVNTKKQKQIYEISLCLLDRSRVPRVTQMKILGVINVLLNSVQKINVRFFNGLLFVFGVKILYG